MDEAEGENEGMEGHEHEHEAGKRNLVSTSRSRRSNSRIFILDAVRTISGNPR